MGTPFKMERGVKYRDAAKTSIIPVKNIDPEQELLKKPEWMKIKIPANGARIQSIKSGMRRHGLHSVCEEASCPNLHECFNHGNLYDSWGNLYPSLSVLRCRARQTITTGS